MRAQLKLLWNYFGHLFVIVFALLIPSLANAQVDPLLSQKQEQMLKTTIIVRAGGSVGAGFVVFSSKVGPENKKKVLTLVITNHHVVESAIESKMPVQVSWKDYDSDSHEIGVTAKVADVLDF